MTTLSPTPPPIMKTHNKTVQRVQGYRPYGLFVIHCVKQSYSSIKWKYMCMQCAEYVDLTKWKINK